MYINTERHTPLLEKMQRDKETTLLLVTNNSKTGMLTNNLKAGTCVLN